MADMKLAVGRVVDLAAWVGGGITQLLPVNRGDIVPTGTYVAYGMAAPVRTLFTEPSPPDSASMGLTLHEYLTIMLAPESTRAVFTGHSLDGTLSPMLALTLAGLGALKGEGLVYITARASPGNRGFANIFAQTFPTSTNTCPETGYAVCAEREKHTVHIRRSNYITHRIRRVLAQCQCQQIAHHVRPTADHILLGVKPEATPEDVTEFLGVALGNHNAFYNDMFGAKLLDLECNELAKKTEMLLEYPVIGDIEWGKEHPAEVEAAVAAPHASCVFDDNEE